MGTYTQEDRLIAISVEGLDDDTLLLQGFTGYEAVSRPFSFHLDLLSQQDAIDPADLIGQNATITIQTSNESSPRYINGYISRFAQSGNDKFFYHYQMELVPWLWFLTRHADCRIFQNASVIDIVTQLFQEQSAQPSSFGLSLKPGDYDDLEYCVQYRETTFNFVSRLLEHAGIFYYFEHTEDDHKLILADGPAALSDCPIQSVVSYQQGAGGLQDEDRITRLHSRREFKTGSYVATDYNFETPSASLLAPEDTVIQMGGNSDYEVFDYPGIHGTADQGKKLSKVRMQEHEAAHHVISASGNVRAFIPGYNFSLEDHFRKDMNGKYLLTEVRHHATVGGSYHTGEPGGDDYSNQFSCIPASVPYRPPRITPKPFVQGPQTALVVGKEGEEIWVDNYGRVIVQFYWDREGKKNENSSCWIRVSQPWAGGNWGAMWIPRIGQEVIVSFLEGDPDRPIITGRVYNAEQMPPYALPDYQTRSTFMSRSSKGGGASDYNELRFEDKMGDEQIFINAQKDMDLRVENDSREFIGANRHLIVTTNQQELIQTDKHLHVKGDHFEKIEGNLSLNVGGNQMESVTGNKSLNVTGDQKESVTGNVSLSVTGNQSESVTGNVSLSVTQGKSDSITMGYAMTAMSIHLSAETGIVIECPLGITLSSGANSIDIGPEGVFVTGTPFVFLNSGSSPASTEDPSGGSPDSPDAPTDPQDPDTADDGSKGTKLN